MEKTLIRLIDESCASNETRPALGFAFQRPLTYRELQEQSIRLAALLRDEGIRKEDRVAILAENSPQWGIAYFAIVRLGAIAVPILPDFTEADIQYILKDSEAKILFTTQPQLEKICGFNAHRFRAVITLDDSADRNCLVETEKFTDALARAAALPERKIKAVSEQSPAAEDIASIIYTSGTSGHSKAVMLTHKNFFSTVESTQAVIDCRGGWTFLSVLPMSHVYEFAISFLLPLSCGAKIVYAGKTPTPRVLESICRKERPNVICLVPMIMEKIYKKKILPALEGSKIIRTALKLPVIRKPILTRVGGQLKKFFGDDLLLVAFGGAALNIEVERFLAEADFPYLAGYGLTETAPLVSGGPWGDPTIALGSSGKPVPGVEVKITVTDPVIGLGEIHVRGDNVMKGYYKNPGLTAETIDRDGWLATGDLGYLDEKNNLFIEGRSKSVIVLSHGENIYPEAIEEKIYAYADVAECLVVESGRDKLAARVYLDYEVIDQATAGKSPQEKLDYIAELLKKIKREVNGQLPSYSQLSQIIEQREPFSKTATHKIKRYLYNSLK